ncbi:MAG: methyltransferase domain-containing protein [Alphaproteobacteria bacterium]|nr:methyltransferase domain-containing protein [Alphaproteobacteria bacterium]
MLDLNAIKNFLHVGCGPMTKMQIKGFDSAQWHEIRFDIDESVKPDIIGTLADMKAVPNHSMDALYSSHNIEHLFPHEVVPALREFHRVLKDDGFVVLTCPDLQSVCEAVARGNLIEPLYQSPAGPISPIDILYGHRGFIANGNVYMAHKCGFTYPVLQGVFFEAGFVNVFGGVRPEQFDLWAIAFKTEHSEEHIRTLAESFLP